MDEPEIIRTGVAAAINRVQYERGYQMYMANETTASICAATGLDKHQVAWLTTKGDDSCGYTKWSSLAGERVATEMERTAKVTDQMMESGGAVLNNATNIVKNAQNYIQLILASAASVAGPTLAKAQANQKLSNDDLAKLAMPKDVRETLKVLGGIANMESAARTFRLLFEQVAASGTASLSGKTGKINLAPEAILPARVSSVEDLPDGGDGGIADPLDVLPEVKDMTMDELQEFIDTRTLPAREYGEEEAPPKLPPGLVDLEP